MAIKCTIGGVDKTSSVVFKDGVTIQRLLNERATAQFTTELGYLPARFAEVTWYDVDGTTPIFGGVILKREIDPFKKSGGTEPYFTKIDAVDYFTYLDWAYISLSYGSPVTLEDVLDDIVAELPVSYGITVDAGQVTGPTLAAFSWDRKRASDAIRELTDRTGYVATMSPAKALKMFVPGTDAAPQAMTDGDPNCQTFDWSDSDRIPANHVTVLAGPTGTALTTQRWTADGIATSWVTDIPAAGAPVLVEVNDGVTPYLATVGAGGMFEWDTPTHTLTLGTDPVPGSGTVLVLGPSVAAGDAFTTDGFLGIYPFAVSATTGATPVIQTQIAYPDVTDYAQAVEIAEGLLTQLDQQPREAKIASRDVGWAPGQALTVALTARMTADFVLTGVTMRLQVQLPAPVWVYELQAIESDVYQGSYLDQWRALTGGSSGIGSVSGGGSGGGSTTVLSSPVYMGGSYTQSVTDPTTNTLIQGAVPYVASASFTGRLRVNLKARDAGVGVVAVISDGAVAVETSVVTSQTFVDTTIPTVAIVAGNTYRVYVRNNATGDGYVGYAQLEAA